MGTEMRRLARRSSSSSNNNNNNNNIAINKVKVLAMGPRIVSPSVGNARWRGIERGPMTFIIGVGNCMDKTKFPPLLLSVLDCSISSAAFHFPPFFLHVFTHPLSRSHSHSPSSIRHLSHTLFPGDRIVYQTCLEPHRIRTTHVPSTGLASFLSCHFTSSLPASPCALSGICLFSWRSEVLCLVLFLSCVALSCRVRFHCLLSILFFLSLFLFFCLTCQLLIHKQMSG